MTNKVGVSIIVPVYNAEKYLQKCINCILSQTFTDFECILVDDCSKDNSLMLCEEYIQKDNRIKLIRNKTNIGSSLTRKAGFENCSGEYVIYIDADDFIEIDMLDKLYSKAISENYDMTYCDYYCHNKSNNVIYMKVPELSANFLMNIKYSILDLGDGGAVWNKLVKRVIYEKIEFPKDGYAEDQYIATQIFFYIKKTAYVNTALYHYQYNHNSWTYNSRRNWARYVGLKNNFNKIFVFIIKNYGKNLDIFEPELSRRIKYIKEMNPITPRNMIKRTLRIVIPIKPWRIWLRNMFHKYIK